MAGDHEPVSREQGSDPALDERGPRDLDGRVRPDPLPHGRAADAGPRSVVPPLLRRRERIAAAILRRSGKARSRGPVESSSRGGSVPRPQRLPESPHHPGERGSRSGPSDRLLASPRGPKEREAALLKFEENRADFT